MTIRYVQRPTRILFFLIFRYATPTVSYLPVPPSQNDDGMDVAMWGETFSNPNAFDPPGVPVRQKSLRSGVRSGVASPASPLSVASNFSDRSALSEFSNLSTVADASRPSGSERNMAAEAGPSSQPQHVQRSYSTTPNDGRKMSPPHPSLPPRPIAHTWCLDDFRVSERVGFSKLSNVYRATHKTSGMDIALKCYLGNKLDAFTMTQVRREIEIHSTVTHRSIATFHGSFEENGNICMIHEYARRGDVYDALSAAGGVFSEQRTSAEIIGPVASAVAYLHNRGVMHRDIKPENVLLSDHGGCLLTDFGFALDYRKNRCVTRLGTTDYMAPEIVMCDKPRRDALRAADKSGYGPEVDCWAIGVLAYECLVGTAPFEVSGVSNTEETYQRILMGQVLELPVGMGNDAKDFITGCLRYDPNERLTANQILNHPWIKKHNKRQMRGHSQKNREPSELFDVHEEEHVGGDGCTHQGHQGSAPQVFQTSSNNPRAWLGRHKSASAKFPIKTPHHEETWPGDKSSEKELDGSVSLHDATPQDPAEEPDRRRSLDGGDLARSRSVGLFRGFGRLREFVLGAEKESKK